MLPVALSLLGAGATFLIAKMASGGAVYKSDPLTMPAQPKAPPVPRPSPLPVAEPPVARVETKAPPPPPPPPVDTSTSLPTPPVPVPVAAPAPMPMPVSAAPPVVAQPTPLPVPEPRPAPIEVAPPPPPPPPPVDTSAALPTPAVQEPVAAAPAPVIATPSTGGPPADFDPQRAAALAPELAQNIKTKQYDFDRALLKQFQRAAGLTVDGVYGNDSWGALLYFSANAPKAVYKPSTPTPYPWAAFVNKAPPAPVASQPVAPVAAPIAQPAQTAPAAELGPQPPPGFNPTAAKKLAKQVNDNLDKKGKLYSQALLKQFQTAAGIAPDGLYGGGSRRALMFYGITRPLLPLFKPTATPPTYPWAAQATGSV